MNPGTILITMLFITTVACSCDSGERKKKSGTKNTAFDTALSVDERLKGTDSLVLVFYKDPYGTDSTRYTRYYTQISVVGEVERNLLQQQLSQGAIRQESFRQCRGEGKIWCYAKGKVFQTLYFSMRCPDCCHVFLIRDGFYYYSPVLESLRHWLAAMKQISKEPANGAAVTGLNN